MERLAINEVSTYRWSFEEDVHHYAKAGLKGIGVWRQKLSDFGEEKGADLLRECGMRVSSLLWAGGFTGSDGRTFKDSVEDARQAIRTAALLAANCLVVYPGGRGGHTHNHARRLFKSALNEIAPFAAELDVTLALEPMHAACAADWTFLTDLDETNEWLDSIGSVRVKLVFDTYHLGLNDQVLQRIPQIAPCVVLVQLGDAKGPPEDEQNRCRLGEGTIPLSQIVRAFNQAGYDGFFEVELMGEEIEACDYDSLVEHSKQAFAELV